MRTIRPVLLLATSWILLAAPPAGAQDDSPLATADPDVRFVLGNVEFILLHELAHLLIRDLGIPVIGPEEGAADYLATIVLIRSDLFDAQSSQRTTRYLLDSADGLAAAWEAHERTRETRHYWGSHLLTIQRHFNIICLIYGSDPRRFAALPGRVEMPDLRAAGCPEEYARTDEALQWVLANYGRREGDPVAEEIDIEYAPPATRTSARVLDALRASGIVENTMRLLVEQFSVPAGFRVAFRPCREPQARWLPSERELVVCHELFDHYYALARTRGTRRQLVP